MKTARSLNREEVINWLVEKFAGRLDVPAESVDIDMLFTDFGIDSTEVLVLMGELEHWSGLEVSPTAMWYHPTISRLADHIAETCVAER